MAGCVLNRHEVRDSSTYCSVVATLNQDETRRSELGNKPERHFALAELEPANVFLQQQNQYSTASKRVTVRETHLLNLRRP